MKIAWKTVKYVLTVSGFDIKSKYTYIRHFLCMATNSTYHGWVAVVRLGGL